MVIVAPSILACNFCRLGEECQRVLEATHWLHVDVMDGHFVPNLTLGPSTVKALRGRFPAAHLDCHLMVSKPSMWVQPFISAGASSLTIHWESFADLQGCIECIEIIRRTANDKTSLDALTIGLAIKPETGVGDIPAELLQLVDFVLIMTVEPGFGGQALISSCLGKIAMVKGIIGCMPVQVDGGITLDNYRQVIEAGATILVVGTAVFGASDPSQVVRAMSDAIK
jgi:ribulose-phosphate 3-epimerase